ncbi:hypothetical protein CEXT_613501 [Caerostris extrusa]|uniref:Uncharacterized protein n=1 Tax=Caerostris extrusa TaxID=172846 RepID=A0AAV4RC29_CAEEX|nr:hypothetical protein CEXT_613501 [Caerostris extrusa]
MCCKKSVSRWNRGRGVDGELDSLLPPARCAVPFRNDAIQDTARRHSQGTHSGTGISLREIRPQLATWEVEGRCRYWWSIVYTYIYITIIQCSKK